MIFLIGPLNGVVTGQSYAFNVLCEHFKKDHIVFSTIPKSSLLIIRLFYFLFFFMKLFFSIIYHRPTVIYISISRGNFSWLRDYFVIIFNLLAGGKTIIHLHGSDFSVLRESFSPFLTFLFDFVYNKVDSFIVLSSKMKEQFNCYPGKRVVVVPNFHEISCGYKKHMNPIQLLYFSNVMNSKGVLFLLNSLKSLDFNYKLRICGKIIDDGTCDFNDFKREFYDLIDSNSNVIFYGPVYGVEKQSFFHDADIFVLPTFYKTEAQPISLIEAMSAGCFILSTKHNYNADLVNKCNGVLIEPRCSNSIALALNYIVSDLDNLNRVKYYNYSKERISYSLETHISNINKEINSFV